MYEIINMAGSLIERIKDQIWYLNGRFLSNPKAQPVTDIIVDCRDATFRFYSDTPNTIIYYNNSRRSGFFRECRRHVTPREYVSHLLDDYCMYVYNNQYSSECRYILDEKLKDRVHFFKFFNMGAGTSKYTRISRFRTTHNPKFIGIEKPYPQWFEDQLLKLVQYIWGPLDEYKYNSFLQYGDYNVYNANRSIVTKRIADIFNMNEIILGTEYIWLLIDNKRRLGVSIDVSPGMDPNNIKNLISTSSLTGNFQRNLIMLNLLDIICVQKDHRPGNYFISINNDNMIDSLTAFDNDCPTTLFPFFGIRFSGYSGETPIIDKNGLINRPFLPRPVVDKILKINPTQVIERIRDNISNVQLEALLYRISLLKKSITRSLGLCLCKLLDDNEWNNETIQIELSSKYGQTYLCKFVEKYCK